MTTKTAQEQPGYWTQVGYFYQPLPAYPHILKCQGIATNGNRDWMMALPGMILVPEYIADRIHADTHAPVGGGL